MVTQRSSRGPFGPRLHLGGGTVQLAVGLVAISVLTGLLGLYWLLLSPSSVIRGAVWQPLTYGFVELSPVTVLFSALCIVSCGGALESWWGQRRTVRFLVGVTVASGVVTTLLGLLIPGIGSAYFTGGSTLASVAWCAYGWTLRRMLVTFYGITVTGDQLALIGIGLVVLDGALGSLVHIVPDAIALSITYYYVHHVRR
ncbi:MAG: DUF1751 domain-containing protein [Kofleriaceae bacterium]|nr:DUF1751 domain-containing protein [Kofleriaceae bacterium]